MPRQHKVVDEREILKQEYSFNGENFPYEKKDQYELNYIHDSPVTHLMKAHDQDHQSLSEATYHEQLYLQTVWPVLVSGTKYSTASHAPLYYSPTK